MLTDEQFEAIGDAVAPLFQGLEKRTVQSVAKHVKKLLPYLSKAGAQVAVMRARGASMAAVRREARKALATDLAYRAALGKESAEYRREVEKSKKDARREARLAALTVLPLVVKLLQASNEAAAVSAQAARAGNSVELMRPANVEYASDNVAFALPMDTQSGAEAEDASADGGDAAEGENGASEGSEDVPADGAEQIARALAELADEQLQNIVNTSAFQVGGANTSLSRVFQRVVDDVFTRFVNGELSIDEALRRAVSELAARGMRTVTYTASGRTIVTQTDVAVRRCLQTAAAQASGRVLLADCKRMGVNHVEVSAHWGARTDGSGGHADHLAWQGKAYQIEGSSEGYPNLTEATGYPGDLLGLFGYNCRHSASPFWAGISTPTAWPKEPEPKTYDGKEYNYYEATQRMRKLERELRAQKRWDYGERAAGGQGVPKSRIEALKNEYRDFCKAMGIRPAWNRTIVDGEKPDFNRIFEK